MLEVEIVNWALLRVGHTQLLQGLTDKSAAAQAASGVLAFARDVALEAYPWPFATKRVALSLLAGVERTDWEYVYQVPSDCIAPRYLVLEGVRSPMADQRSPFQVEASDDGATRVLLTDLEDAELVYTMRHTISNAWSPGFCDALAWRLAAELALGLKKDAGLARGALVQYDMAISAAAAMVANQAQPDLLPETPSIAARR
jgi:hypothetical protein